MRGYFPFAFGTIATASAIIGLGLIPAVPDVVSFFALVPLVLYHLYIRGWLSFVVLPPLNRGDAEIDSVYYIGFLITVTELAASALILFRDSGAGTRPILIRFAVGLIATGYAVIARLHLQSTFQAPAEDSDGLWHAYATRADTLLSDLELAIRRVKDFGAAVERELQQGVLHLERSLQEAATKSAHSFTSELRRAADGARGALEAVHALASDDAARHARELLRQQLDQAASAGGDLAQSLEQLARQSESLSTAMKQARETSHPLIDTTARLGDSLNDLANAAASLPTAIGNIELAADSAKGAAESAVRAADRVAALAGAAASAAPSIERFSTALGGLEERLEGIRQPLADVGSALEHASTEANAMAQTVGQTNTGVAQVNLRFNQLLVEVEVLTERLGKVGPALERDVESSAAAVLRLADGLASLADLIIQRTRQRQGLI